MLVVEVLYISGSSIMRCASFLTASSLLLLSGGADGGPGLDSTAGQKR